MSQVEMSLAWRQTSLLQVKIELQLVQFLVIHVDSGLFCPAEITKQKSDSRWHLKPCSYLQMLLINNYFPLADIVVSI